MSGWRKLGSEEVFWHPLFGLERQIVASDDQRQEVIAAFHLLEIEKSL